MAGRLEGRVAIVTGAAQGIGAAIALRLAEEGARVVVGDLREAQGQELARRIGGPFQRCDVVAEADLGAIAAAPSSVTARSTSWCRMPASSR